MRLSYYLSRLKVKMVSAFPLTNIYFSIVIEKAIAVELEFNCNRFWRREGDLALCEAAPVNSPLDCLVCSYSNLVNKLFREQTILQTAKCFPNQIPSHKAFNQIKKPPSRWYFYLAERGGFEPPIRLWRIHDFQSCSFDHSDISPNIWRELILTTPSYYILF